MNGQEEIIGRSMSRRGFLELGAAGLAGAALLGVTESGSMARAASRVASSKSITLGNIGWDEDVAVSALTKIVLQQDLGYSVTEKLADVGLLFQGVGMGDLAAFQDVWMPNHTAYYNRVKNNAELLKPWFIGTTKFSLAAPSYMHISSIAQINGSGAQVIYGIEPGAAITPKIQNNVLPWYHLKVEFQPSSTAAMLAAVARDYKAKRPFIFIAWSPHWMNYVYKFNYLSDPKGALGNLTKPSRLTSIVHKGLEHTDPAVYTFIKSIRLTEAQVNQMEFTIRKAGGDAPKGVQSWLNANRHVVQPWITAAKKAK